MNRYSLIRTKMPREMVLLQGTGCKWKRCIFCDYHNDTGINPFETNRHPLSLVTGKYGVLDVINSGSCTELDDRTLDLLSEMISKKKIHTLWFESHWMYREKLSDFSRRFPNVCVHFRTGVETFDPIIRDSWDKGIPSAVTPEHIAAYFHGVCLLFGISGQTEAGISADIEIALKNFKYFSLNAFNENSTPLKRDENLINRIIAKWHYKLADIPCVEFLISNTDLGVGS